MRFFVVVELSVEYVTSQLVQVWVLDATPGKVRFGGHGEDHPGELIATLLQMPSSLPSRRALIDALTHKGFSPSVAQWMTTNLKATTAEVHGDSSGYKWVFDLEVLPICTNLTKIRTCGRLLFSFSHDVEPCNLTLVKFLKCPPLSFLVSTIFTRKREEQISK